MKILYTLLLLLLLTQANARSEPEEKALFIIRNYTPSMVISTEMINETDYISCTDKNYIITSYSVSYDNYGSLFDVFCSGNSIACFYQYIKHSKKENVKRRNVYFDIRLQNKVNSNDTKKANVMFQFRF